MTISRKNSGKITKFQNFEARTINRKLIKGAPYNPRTISDYAFKELKKNISRIGLLDTLVWNEASGNLVSGHQRIKVLDILNKTDDYELTVAVVNLTPKEEKEQNIFFNSRSVQGEFDEVLLKDLLSDTDVDFTLAGIDEADMTYYGIELVDSNELRDEMKNEFKPEPKEEKVPATKEEIKALKEQIREKGKQNIGEADTYVSLSFKSLDTKRKFLKYFGFNQDELFIVGEKVNEALKIE